MNAYTTTNIDLATANGSEPIVAPYSKDFMSGVDNFRNVVMPRYCPSCDDRPVRRIAGYRNFGDDELSEPEELDMPIFYDQNPSGNGTSTSNCTFWQKLTGKCKDNASGDGKTGTTGQQVISTLNNIFSWLNTQQQQQANASNYPTPSFDDEKTGLSTGAKIGIGIVSAALIGFIIYKVAKKQSPAK